MVDVHEWTQGIESEIGATTGESHAGLLIKTIGRERGLASMFKGGPPPVRIQRSP